VVARTKKIKEFRAVLIVLVGALVLTSFQTFQLYSIQKVLADEGLSALGSGGTSSSTSQGSAIPDQVGGCFRG